MFDMNRAWVRGNWHRKDTVKSRQYDPTTDGWSYAHRCSHCDCVSYFPKEYPDNYCRRCGAFMKEGEPNDYTCYGEKAL